VTPRWIFSRKVHGGALEPLPKTSSGFGWLCSEGDLVVLDATTENLPTLAMAGQTVMPKGLTHTEGGYQARFEVIIDTWAGLTRLEAADGIDHLTLMLDVRPHAHKLGGSAFDDMLAELSERSAGLIWGLSPGAATGTQVKGALSVVHPAVVASQLPRFVRLVGNYLAEPPLTTLRVARPRALDLARRTDMATLRRLGRRPELLRVLQGDSHGGQFVDPRQSIEQSEVIASTDHPMTRYLAHLLHQLVRRFRSGETLLRTAAGRPFRDPVIEAHAAHLAEVLAAAAHQMQGLARHPLMRSVRPEPLDGSALQSLADHPVFGALHRVGRWLLHPGLAYGPDASIESALKHTYDLFEILVLFRLVDGLPDALGPGWTMRPPRAWRLARREERPMDRAAWWFDGPGTLTIELRYQQWFSRARPVPDGRLFSSLSGVAIPDYILILRKDQKPIRWVILDAKYRSGQQAVDAGLADVHRYRDALKIRGIRANGAFVIVPQLRVKDAPYASLNFLRQHAFGVLKLFEHNWLYAVTDTLLAECKSRMHSHLDVENYD
jgi:hypothetical protein